MTAEREPAATANTTASTPTASPSAGAREVPARTIPPGEVYQCRGCRYDLSATTDNRCPECGRTFDPTNPKTVWRGGPGWLARVMMTSPGIPFLVVFVLPAVVLSFWWAKFLLPSQEDRSVIWDALVTIWALPMALWVLRLLPAVALFRARWKMPERPRVRPFRRFAAPVLAAATAFAVFEGMPLKLWFHWNRAWFEEEADSAGKRFEEALGDGNSENRRFNERPDKTSPFAVVHVPFDGGSMFRVEIVDKPGWNDQRLQWCMDRLLGLRNTVVGAIGITDLLRDPRPRQLQFHWWFLRRPDGELPEYLDVPGEPGTPFLSHGFRWSLGGGWWIRSSPNGGTDPLIVQARRNRLRAIAGGAHVGNIELLKIAEWTIDQGFACRYVKVEKQFVLQQDGSSPFLASFDHTALRDFLLPALSRNGNRGQVVLLIECTRCQPGSMSPEEQGYFLELIRRFDLPAAVLLDHAVRNAVSNNDVEWWLDNFVANAPPGWRPSAETVDAVAARLRGRPEDWTNGNGADPAKLLVQLAAVAPDWPAAEQVLRPLIRNWDAVGISPYWRSEALTECARWGPQAVTLLCECVSTGAGIDQNWISRLPADSQVAKFTPQGQADWIRDCRDYAAKAAGLLDTLALMGELPE